MFTYLWKIYWFSCLLLVSLFIISESVTLTFGLRHQARVSASESWRKKLLNFIHPRSDSNESRRNPKSLQNILRMERRATWGMRRWKELVLIPYCVAFTTFGYWLLCCLLPYFENSFLRFVDAFVVSFYGVLLSISLLTMKVRSGFEGSFNGSPKGLFDDALAFQLCGWDCWNR